MSGFNAPAVIPGTPQINVIQLLTNGKVLIHCNDLSTYLMEPDQFGDYGAATFRRVGDSPYSHLYGNVTLDNDGKAWLHGGEYGTGISGTSVFDPVTETWVGYTANIATHSSVMLSDDGRMIGSRILPVGVTTPVGAATGPAAFYTETGHAKIPDGRGVIFYSTSGQQIDILNLAHPAGYVSAGSYNGADTITTFNGATYLNALAVDFRSNQRKFSSNEAITYEIGPNIYMPTIGKVACIGGQGWLFTFDPLTSTLVRVGGCPIEPRDVAQSTQQLGVVHSNHNGQNSNTITVGGIFKVNCAGIPVPTSQGVVSNWNALSQSHGFFVYSASGNSVQAYNASTVTYDISTNTLNFVGVNFNPNFGNDNSTTTTGLPVTWGRPFMNAMDAAGALLPNGNLMFTGGTDSLYLGGNFTSKTRWMKWDGVSSTAVFLMADETGNANVGTHSFQVFPLPDGSMLIKGSTAGALQRYIPTTAEATPPGGAKPVITSFASVVEPAQRVVLSGTQLNGLHEGGAFGDDGSPRTNFPVVRFTNAVTHRVYYARSDTLTYRGIQAGRPSTAVVTIPVIMPTGAYTMEVVASGIASASVPVSIRTGYLGGAAYMNPYR